MANNEGSKEYLITVQGKRLTVTALDTIALADHPNTQGKTCSGRTGIAMIYSGYKTPVVICDTCYSSVK